jgi:hypothetical protein
MSYSTQSSSSSSSPSYLETPENGILDQVAQYAQQLAGQMYSWAQQTYAQTSQITNQAVGNFFTVSQNMLGLSNNLTNQYNNLFAPENAQLVADANSYASPSRMAVDMGMAGATQAQAGSSQLAASEQSLRDYGIDPSAGRYAALDKAAAVQNAANIAGAENTQRVSDIATGQQLRSQAVQVGAQLPAAIANVNNTAIQANTGASNASLANANTGANLFKLPNDYLGTAMQLKLPPTGQNSQSQGSGFSTSPQQPHTGSSGGGGSGGGGSGGGYGGSGGGQAWMPSHTGYQSDQTGGGGGGSNPSSRIMQLPAAGGGGADWGAQSGAIQDMYGPNGMGGIDPNSFTGDSIYQSDPFGANGSIGSQTTDPWGSGQTSTPFDNGGFGQTLPQDNSGFGGADQTFGNMGGGTNTEYGNISYDPSANQAQLPSGWQDPSPQVSTDPGIWGDTGANTTSPGSDFSAGSYDTSGDPGFAYASGGAIPTDASPSGGARVDDVPAQGPGGQRLQMNANEFVIPQDVALWKGQEFFQNLIDQSRKRRMGASARPKPVR